jgi:hypothetical protein
LPKNRAEHRIGIEVRAQAGTPVGRIRERREGNDGVRGAVAAVARPGNHDQREIAAGRVPADEERLRRAATLGAVLENPFIRAATIVEAIRARVLRHESVVDRENGCGIIGREPGGQGAMALRAARHEGPAMQIENATPRIGARRKHPLARHAARIDGADLRIHRLVTEGLLQVHAHPLDALASRHSCAGVLLHPSDARHHGRMLGTGLAAPPVHSRPRRIEGRKIRSLQGQVGEAPEREADEHQQQENGHAD